jgi:hypothetical protein
MIVGILQERVILLQDTFRFFKTVLANRRMGMEIFEPQKVSNNRATCFSFRKA